MMTIRGDALPKLTGRARFVGDVTMAGMCFAAVTRSYAAHAKITRIDTAAARALPGVLAVVTAADVTPSLYGRRVKDVPILAREQVRFVGERVAAVVAETRELAEEAAALIDVEYEDLPAVFDADEALRDGSPLVHQEPERYENAQDLVAREPNLQSLVAVGSSEQVDLLLQSSAFSIEREYRTPSGHQGYIEPHGCVCSVESDGTVHVWATNKSPYQLREQVAACLELPVSKVVVEPVFIGGDFGGKGSPMDVPLCAELARITGRPVKLTLRYVEDLIAANPRHASRTRVRVGCSADGKLTGLSLDSVLNGGAYAGFKPRADASLHGVVDCALSYELEAFHARARIAYTNAVPKGHMRAPGSPQALFAVESALDELALEAGIDPVELRLRNVVGRSDGDEGRAAATIRAAVQMAEQLPESDTPLFSGLAMYARTTSVGAGSLRVSRRGEKVEAEVGVPETGTGSHDLVARHLSRELGVAPEGVVVRQVATDALPEGGGAGGSRVTVTLMKLLELAMEELNRDDASGEDTVMVSTEAGGEASLSFCVQLARVSVDTATGDFEVRDIVTALDTGVILSPVAHQMQIEGGTVMGLGFALLEDLGEDSGQVWSANLGEFRLPTAGDVPALHTAIVADERFLKAGLAKSVGEMTNVAVAPAIANALAAAGIRLRKLPLQAEDVLWAVLEREAR